jgi:dCTP deaminase
MVGKTGDNLMVISGGTLREHYPSIVTPFSERERSYGLTYGVGFAGYDVRLQDGLILDPKDFKLGVTLERFSMPLDLLGVVHDKSTWARQGLSVNNTVIEPGWEGFLTLEIFNHSQNSIALFAGMPIVQVVFHKLDLSLNAGYNGKYQHAGPAPQEAIFD